MPSWRDKAVPLEEEAPATTGASSWRSKAVVVEDPSGVEAHSPAPSLDDYTPEAIRKSQGFNGLADTAMYDDVQTREEAEARYEQAKADPRNESRVILPPREAGMLDPRNIPVVGGLFDNGPYAVPLKDKVMSGVANAGIELAKSGAALADTGFNTVADAFGVDAQSRGAEFIEKNVPQLKAGDAGDEFVQMIPQAVVGGVLGKKLLGSRKAPGLDTSRWAKAARFVHNEAAIGVGAGAAMSEDTGTLVLGKDKLLGSLWDPGKDAEYNEKVLAGKLNVIGEGIAGAGIAVPVTKLAGFITKFFKTQLIDKAVGGIKTSTAEDRMFEMMVEQTSNLEHMTPDQLQEATRQIKQIVQDNREVILKGVEESSDINIDLDPMAALEAGLRARGDIKAAERVKLQRDAVFSRKDRGTSGKMTEYQQGTEEFRDTAYSDLGGAPAVENARGGIVKSGLDDVQVFDDAASDAATQLDAAKSEITRTLEEDPTFGTRLTELGKESGVNINITANTTADQIVDQTRRAYRSMADTRARLYEEIPEGAVIDHDALASALEPMKDSPAVDALPSSLREIMEGDVDDIAESLQGIDYKSLHNKILPGLSKAIGNLRGNGLSISPANLSAISQLDTLKKHILGHQYNFQASANKKNKPLLDAINAARDYERKFQSTFADGSPLGKIAQLERNIPNEIVDGNRVYFNEGANRVLKDDAAALVDQSFNNKNRHSAQTFIELLDSPDGGGSAPLVADFIIGKAATRLSDTVRTKGISEVNFDEFGQTLRDEAAVLYENFPEQAKQLDDFVLNLRKQQQNLPELEATLKVATDRADQARRDIIDGELNRFFNNQGMPISDAQDVFNEIFSSNKASDELRSLMARAGKAENPELVREGLQAAYAKAIKFDPATVRDKSDKLVGYAEILFPNNPRVVEGTKAAFNLMKSTKVGDAPENLVGRIPRATYTESSDAIGKMITATFGVLNHTAAVIRGAVNTGLKSVDPAKTASETLDAMYSDPDEFFRLADQYIKSQETGIAVQKSFDEFSRYLSKYAVTRGDDQDSMGLDEESQPVVDNLESTQGPTEGRLEPTGTNLPEAPRLPPVDAPVDDLEQTEDRFPQESFFRLEDRDRQPLNNSERTRMPDSEFVATYEF